MRKIPQRIFVRCSLLLMPKLRFLCSGTTSSEKYARAFTFFPDVQYVCQNEIIPMTNRDNCGSSNKSYGNYKLIRKILVGFGSAFSFSFYEFNLAKIRIFQSNLKSTTASNVTLAILPLSQGKKRTFAFQLKWGIKASFLFHSFQCTTLSCMFREIQRESTSQLGLTGCSSLCQDACRNYSRDTKLRGREGERLMHH